MHGDESLGVTDLRKGSSRLQASLKSLYIRKRSSRLQASLISLYIRKSDDDRNK